MKPYNNIEWMMATVREYQKELYFRFTLKLLILLIIQDFGNPSKQMGIPQYLLRIRNLYNNQEATMRTKSNSTAFDHHTCSIYILNTTSLEVLQVLQVWKYQVGVKILAGTNVSNLRYANITLVAETEKKKT